MEINPFEGANPHENAVHLVNRRKDGFIVRLQLPADAFRANTTTAKKSSDQPHVSVEVDLTYYAYARTETGGALLTTLEIPPGETRGCYVEGNFKPTIFEIDGDTAMPRRIITSAPVNLLPVQRAPTAARDETLATRERVLDIAHHALLGHLENRQSSSRVTAGDLPLDKRRARPMAYVNPSLDNPARVEINEKVQYFDVLACVTDLKLLFHDGVAGIRAPIGDFDHFAALYLTPEAIDTYREALWAVIRAIAVIPDQENRAINILQEHAGYVTIPPIPYLQLLQQNGHVLGPADASLAEYGNDLLGVLVCQWEYRVQSPAFAMVNRGAVPVHEVKFTQNWVVILFPEDYYPPDALDPTIDQTVNGAILECMDLMARGLGTSVDATIDMSGRQVILANNERAHDLLEDFWQANNYVREHPGLLQPATPPFREVIALIYQDGASSGMMCLEAAPAANLDVLLHMHPLPPVAVEVEPTAWPEIVVLLNDRLRARGLLPLHAGELGPGNLVPIERQCAGCKGTIVIGEDAHVRVGRHWLCMTCHQEQEHLREQHDELSHQFQDAIAKAGQTNHWITLSVDIMRLRSKGDEVAAKASEQSLEDLYKQLGIFELDRQIEELGAKIFSPYD